MKNWSKDNAIKAIQDAIDQIPNVQSAGRKSKQHTRWFVNTLRLLEEIFGAKSMYYLNLSSFPWHSAGNMIIQGWDLEEQIEYRHHLAFLDQMKQANGLLLAAIDHLADSEMDEVYKGKDTPDETSEFFKIINLINNTLRKIIREIPEKEQDIQNRFEDLLVANNIDYSREHPHIEYSSKCYVPDFSFKKIDLAVEIKLCKTDEKRLIAQINDDILAYKTVFRNILFIIYDLGKIRDTDVFKSSFEKCPEVIIKIIKH